MNESQPYEQPPGIPNETPAHLRPGPQSEHVLQHTLARLKSLEDELRVTEGWLAYGAAFAAYLRLSDTTPADPDLLRNFQNTYAGAHATMRDIMTEQLDALGWTAALNTLRAAHGIPDGFLGWNVIQILGRIHEVYDIVELDDWFHLFSR
jgi:hypothetical protein